MKKEEKTSQREVQAGKVPEVDSNLCMVPPSPKLQERIDKEMQKLDKQLSGSVLSKRIKMGRDYNPVGFNDGLIYPGTLFPLGTGPEVARSAAANRAPLTGTLRVIVVLVDFTDKHFATPRSHFEDLFFSLGRVSTGSVREYYREVSHGRVDIVGQVVGPYRLPRTMAQYANGDHGIGQALPNARTMARDAIIKADPTVNFGIYDNDGDGYVDAFIVVHAGNGGEETGNANDIWSHKWVIEGSAYNTDGKRIYAYLTVPEDCKLGVCAHEIGHLVFGFPDLYDTDNSSEGLGNWCLMAGGSWNNGGLTPAHPNPWCKAKQDWISTEVVTNNGTNVAIEDIKTGYKAFKLWKDGAPGTEYFLVENRQKTKFDKNIPNGGLLIWHIDESIADNRDESHYKVALMQADGKRDLESKRNRGDGGDCYPGTTGNKTFNSSSNPHSKSYAGSDTCVAVSNISAPGNIMHADLQVKCQLITKNRLGKEIIKETKEVRKELIKEKDVIKEIRKEVIKEKEAFKEFKEIKEKDIREKPTDGFGNLAGSLQPDYPHSVEERLAVIESMLGQIQPFIEASLRPDIGESFLSDEETENEV